MGITCEQKLNKRKLLGFKANSTGIINHLKKDKKLTESNKILKLKMKKIH